MKRIGSFLIAVALVVGMVGCGEVIDNGNGTVSYHLTISSTSGGSVVEPGEGVHVYEEGTVVNLVAEPDTGHRFVNWTGDVGTVANVDSASTTITMNGNYSIVAHFIEIVEYELTISSTTGGSVTTPGEGTFTYDAGTVVQLVAPSEQGHHFHSWTGDVSTIANVAAARTTITMSGSYSVTATFSENIDYPYSESIRLHPAPDSDEYTWFSFVPDGLRRNATYHIMLVAEGGNTDYEATIKNVRGLTTVFSKSPFLPSLICIGVAIPRGEELGEYAIAMPASVLSDGIERKFYRPDLKVSAIIDEFMAELESYGIQVYDRVLMWGFSNSAMFAQRYCLLHPEKVKAAAIGQAGGALTMGMDSYSGNELDWPVGTNDFTTLTSRGFNANAYNSVPKFIFIGEQDTGQYQSTVGSPEWGWNVEIFTVEQCKILYDIADTDPIRLQEQSAIMNDSGDSIHFKMYPGIGHSFPKQMQDDMVAFFASIINE